MNKNMLSLPENEDHTKPNGGSEPVPHPGKIKNGKLPLDVLAQFADEKVRERYEEDREAVTAAKYTILASAIVTAFAAYSMAGSKDMKYRQINSQLVNDRAETRSAKKRTREALKGKAERDKIVAEVKKAVLECAKTSNNNHDRWTCLSKKLPKKFRVKDKREQAKLDKIKALKKKSRTAKGAVRLVKNGIRSCARMKGADDAKKWRCVKRRPYMKSKRK
ncbi:hypothetical protein ACFL3C_04435 [Patescibacteria group bacterium]